MVLVRVYSEVSIVWYSSCVLRKPRWNELPQKTDEGEMEPSIV